MRSIAYATFGYGVYAQRYDSLGVPQQSEVRVNSYTTGIQHQPTAAMDASGNFVVAWQSSGQDGSGLGVYGQRYVDTTPRTVTALRSQFEPITPSAMLTHEVTSIAVQFSKGMSTNGAGSVYNLANYQLLQGASDITASIVAINYGYRSPVGVVGVICPWNLPLLLRTWKVGPALACGNTVVVKPSEETPQTAALLGEVMNEAGIPKGVYNVVHGFGPGSAGEFVTTHPQVDAITFTGETRTGEVIMKAAAHGARPVSLEMGGKNAAIVFADCDFDAAIEGTMRSVFANCGQVCLGTERVYVERPIFDRFVAALKARAEALKPGPSEEPGVGIGPLISREHKQKVLSYYEKAVREGANDYLTKPCSLGQIDIALQRARDNLRLVHTDRLIDRLLGIEQRLQSIEAGLSRIQRQLGVHQ